MKVKIIEIGDRQKKIDEMNEVNDLIAQSEVISKDKQGIKAFITEYFGDLSAKNQEGIELILNAIRANTMLNKVKSK